MPPPALLEPDTLRGDAAALLASDKLTAPTRNALADRLAWQRGELRVLSVEQMAMLDSVARQLVPLGALDGMVDLAGRFEADLAEGTGDGWRYAAMPGDAEAIVAGLDRVAADGFADMGGGQRDAYLEQVRTGIDGWPVGSALWFEEVLARLVQLAYGHPLVQLSIGYDGMADANGFAVDA